MMCVSVVLVLKIFLSCHFSTWTWLTEEEPGSPAEVVPITELLQSAQLAATMVHGSRRFCILHLGRGGVPGCVVTSSSCVHPFLHDWVCMYFIKSKRSSIAAQTMEAANRPELAIWSISPTLKSSELVLSTACIHHFSILYNMQILSRGFRASPAGPCLSPQN